jgi:hypothetical protein
MNKERSEKGLENPGDSIILMLPGVRFALSVREGKL